MNLESAQATQPNLELSIKFLQNSLKMKMIDNLRSVQNNSWIFNQNKIKVENSHFKDMENYKGEISQVTSELNILSKQLALNTIEGCKAEKDECFSKTERFIQETKKTYRAQSGDKEVFKFKTADLADIKQLLRCFLSPNMEYMHQYSFLHELENSSIFQDTLFIYSDLNKSYYFCELKRQKF